MFTSPFQSQKVYKLSKTNIFFSHLREREEKTNQIFCTLVLRAYPSEQTIEEGREIVFQCRDEGPLRARVEWRRQSLPLPPGKVI